MKLLIDIDDEVYNSLKKGFTVIAGGRGNGKTAMLQTIIPIVTGTPIPDNCRLIDANDYIAQCACFGWLDTISVDEFNSCTPTIGGNANNNG